MSDSSLKTKIISFLKVGEHYCNLTSWVHRLAKTASIAHSSQTYNIDDIYPPLTFSCDNSQGGRALHWSVKGG
ncbi:hypothetical protein [uncultured Nostoc sp.]|uniref:hypothetical protein n=1 Tax=uncultured Nostoc sp. TaxID=340711 RepID=UPI0035CADFA4